MNLAIVNGPNLQALGRREPEHYGLQTMDSILENLHRTMPRHRIDYFQSNHEGALIDCLYELESRGCGGVVLNAGGYTHTSVALADCIRTVNMPVVEVHLSNIFAREGFRQKSLISSACIGVIAGFGPEVYAMGVRALEDFCKNKR